MIIGYKVDHISQILTPKGKIFRFFNIAWIEHLISLNQIILKTTNKHHNSSLQDTISLPSTKGEIHSDQILSGKHFYSIYIPTELAGNSWPSTPLLKTPTRPKITPSQLQILAIPIQKLSI